MKKSLLAVSIAAATGLGMSQNAQADAYAYAFNNIFNLTIASSTGIIPASSVFKLTDGAALTGFANDGHGPTSFSSGTAPFNIDDAHLGIASTNSFAPNGNIGTNYARGDASIVTSELNPGQPPTVSGKKTDVWAVGESYLNSNANGGGSGSVGSTSSFVFVNDDEGTYLDFSFDAILKLVACVDGPPTCADSNAAFPTNAQAASGVSFVITNSLGAKVFDWAPGSNPSIGDGGNNSNPFALTTNVGRDQSNKGVSSIDEDTTGGAKFTARTVAFAPGQYTLSLSDDKRVTTELVNGVPEPETLALMGMGLLGMFFAGRGKSANRGRAA